MDQKKIKILMLDVTFFQLASNLLDSGVKNETPILKKWDHSISCNLGIILGSCEFTMSQKKAMPIKWSASSILIFGKVRELFRKNRYNENKIDSSFLLTRNLIFYAYYQVLLIVKQSNIVLSTLTWLIFNSWNISDKKMAYIDFVFVELS